jgi:hypothetical protein
MKTTLNGIEFCQADVVNQANALREGGHFFLVYDDEMQTLVGGCFAPSFLDALDILADARRLDHRLICEDEMDEVAASELGVHYDYLGDDQDLYWTYDLIFGYRHINMDVTHILAGERR